MPGSPVGPFVGSSWLRQTMLHMETFNMSDRVALNGRSTCDECTCDRNTRELFLNRAQAHLAPYLNRDTCVNVPVSAPASQSRITTKLPIKLYISNTTTIFHGQEQSWETIQIRCDQLTGPHGSCQILRCWYTSETPCSPVSQKSGE